MNTIFIGIAGGTGSGKTTLTEHLVSRFGDDIAVVHHDNYYKRQDCSFEERCKQNYDHPDAFDTDLMIRDLKKLKAGETIYCPVYDYAIHNRTEQSVVTQYLTTVKPMHEQFVEPTRKYADIVVLEGGHNLVALDLIMQRIANHIAEK